MANRNWANKGNLYTMHAKPVLVQCSFVVDSANGNGLGIRSLKGPAVANVFMHTSATPGVSNGVTNPNPSSGLIYIQLADNYNQYLGPAGQGFVSYLASTSTGINSGLTAGAAYVITSLGTTTNANWYTLGVPSSLTPSVGMSFIAASTGLGGSTTGTVGIATASGIMSIEAVGDANQSIAPSNTPGLGAILIAQCLNTSGALTAPHDNSVVSLSFLMSDSSVPMGINSGT